MPEHGILLAVAAQQVDAALKFISEIPPPARPPGRPQCALFLTIAEQHEAAVRLLEVGLTTHAAVHIRGMLEALSDLCLLGISEDHVRRMRYDQVGGAKRLFERVIAVEGLPEPLRVQYQSQLSDLTQSYAPLHEEFRRNRLEQAEAFVRAGLQDLLPQYTMLCSFAHNDLTALAYRHQQGERMAHRSPPSYADTHAFVVMSSVALTRAAHQLQNVIRLPEGRYEHHMETIGKLLQKICELSPEEQAFSGE
ncbi:DUF5677 domain-containing protein [Stenotrophomonas rhizophila]